MRFVYEFNADEFSFTKIYTQIWTLIHNEIRFDIACWESQCVFTATAAPPSGGARASSPTKRHEAAARERLFPSFPSLDTCSKLKARCELAAKPSAFPPFSGVTARVCGLARRPFSLSHLLPFYYGNQLVVTHRGYAGGSAPAPLSD